MDVHLLNVHKYLHLRHKVIPAFSTKPRQIVVLSIPGVELKQTWHQNEVCEEQVYVDCNSPDNTSRLKMLILSSKIWSVRPHNTSSYWPRLSQMMNTICGWGGWLVSQDRPTLLALLPDFILHLLHHCKTKICERGTWNVYGVTSQEE